MRVDFVPSSVLSNAFFGLLYFSYIFYYVEWNASPFIHFIQRINTTTVGETLEIRQIVTNEVFLGLLL